MGVVVLLLISVPVQVSGLDPHVLHVSAYLCTRILSINLKYVIHFYRVSQKITDRFLIVYSTGIWDFQVLFSGFFLKDDSVIMHILFSINFAHIIVTLLIYITRWLICKVSSLHSCLYQCLSEWWYLLRSRYL